jgi:hypothetical protein
VLLLSEVLTSVAPSDEFFSVAQSCGPIEASPKGLADQRSRRRVVAADALVDLPKMSLPSCLGTHFMITPEDAPHL